MALLVQLVCHALLELTLRKLLAPAASTVSVVHTRVLAALAASIARLASLLPLEHLVVEAVRLARSRQQRLRRVLHANLYVSYVEKACGLNSSNCDISRIFSLLLAHPAAWGASQRVIMAILSLVHAAPTIGIVLVAQLASSKQASSRIAYCPTVLTT
jgi:hypothetical protein